MDSIIMLYIEFKTFSVLIFTNQI